MASNPLFRIGDTVDIQDAYGDWTFGGRIARLIGGDTYQLTDGRVYHGYELRFHRVEMFGVAMPNPNDSAIEERAKTTFVIPEINMGLLRQRIEKLNRTAFKIGAEPITLSVVDERLVERDEAFYKVFDVTISGKSPIIAGWQFVATIQHGEDGNILRKSPDFEGRLPDRFRTLGQWCEHCGYHRIRKDTYIIHNLETDEYKQVGRTCLRDFLGHADPYALADWAERLSDLGREIGDLEDREGIGIRGVAYYGLTEFMNVAAAIIRVDGWVSRAMSHMEHEYDKKPIATAQRLFNYYFDDSRYTREWKKTIAVNEQDKAISAAALDWARALPEDVDNDYLWNIRTISKSKAIDSRSFGLAASIISAYQRKLQKDVESTSIVNEYVGEVGGRGIFTLTVTYMREIGSQYGLVTIVSFKDEVGRAFKWFASGAPDLEIGKTYTIRATIKGHGEYRGVKETQITRGKVLAMPNPSIFSDDISDRSSVGSIPMQREIHYFGYETQMLPREFLRLNPPRLESLGWLRAQLQRGAKFAYPCIFVKKMENISAWEVIAHEGRGRSQIADMDYPDEPMWVSVFPQYMRARDLDESTVFLPIYPDYSINQDRHPFIPRRVRLAGRLIDRDESTVPNPDVDDEATDYVSRLVDHGMSRESARRMLNAEFRVDYSKEEFNERFGDLWKPPTVTYPCSTFDVTAEVDKARHYDYIDEEDVGLENLRKLNELRKQDSMTLYHTTDNAHVSSILRDGLLASRNLWFPRLGYRGVYFTMSRHRFFHVEKMPIVVVEIPRSHYEYLVPDILGEDSVMYERDIPPEWIIGIDREV